MEQAAMGFMANGVNKTRALKSTEKVRKGIIITYY
jgi:hypothetical protein